MKAHSIFKAGKAWGVTEDGAMLYDAMFTKPIATGIAVLYNSDYPPEDWEHAKELLMRQGFLKAECELDPNQ